MRRSSSFLVWACALTILACTPTGPELTPEHVEPAYELLRPPPGAWVVIDERGALFEGTEDNPRRVWMKDAESGPRLRVAEVVSERDGLLELRTIDGSPSRGCASSLGFEQNVELHFYVQPRQLHLVLDRPKLLEFEDGTKLELAAGVPVIESGPGPTGRIQVGKTQLVVNVTDDDVGRWWIPTKAPEPVLTPDPRKEPGIALHYGEQSIVAEWPPFVEYQMQQTIEGGRLLTYVDACGRFVMRGPGAVVGRDFNAGILGVVGGRAQFFDSDPWADPLADCSPTTWTARAQTPLTWSSGRRAGMVLIEHVLPRDAELRGDRVCFAASGLEVCIESSTLRSEPSTECTVDASSKPTKPIPQVRVAEAKMSAGIDRDIVRRIVRAHVNEVRSCYAAALTRQPTLAGRIAIAFEIGSNGKVTSSEVESSTIDDARLGKCLVAAPRRWIFPRPTAGGSASVVQTFVFLPT